MLQYIQAGEMFSKLRSEVLKDSLCSETSLFHQAMTNDSAQGRILFCTDSVDRRLVLSYIFDESVLPRGSNCVIDI
jgi:hypothetical protein